MKPHKHAEVIKAWADGKVIQHDFYGDWVDWQVPDSPSWGEEQNYRIKPTPIKIDVVMFQHIRLSPRGNILAHPDEKPNIKYIFDGETRQVKSAEVLK
jgi:hypothetical protein